MEEKIWKLLIAVIIVIILGKYLGPLLSNFFPPFGLIILIVLFVALALWLMGKI